VNVRHDDMSANGHPGPEAPEGPPKSRFTTALRPLLVDAKVAAPLCGLGLRTWRMLDATAQVPRAIRIAHRVLWRLAELEAWTEANCPPRNVWEAMRQPKT